ncbi:hypothetical protein JOC54_003737 [Alkalihalobacillus xiaoxiensis]|uniref:Uncharacterized protein n=1 Tax=Shouchella xiaoxiensis TaxID=766895 RepID=A0ABS2SY39_9BACI|nr:DUF6612 family protein [Shouchella xiaoxiensis]MBM7840445.1 hypothetical protein [Shouchella xiaoxiensis]
MKNTSWFYCSVAVSVLLGACSYNSDETSSDTSLLSLTSEEDESSIQSNTILEKSIKADEQLENYTANLKITDSLSPKDNWDDEEQVMKITEGTLAHQEQPEVTYTNLARYPIHSETQAESPEETLSILKDSTDILANVNNNGWEDVEDISLIEETYLSFDLSPSHQLQLLYSISNYVQVSEYDGLYVLSVEASGDELKQMALNMDLIDQSLLRHQDIELDDTFQVAQLDYMLFINKETLLLEKTNSIIEFIIQHNNEEYVIRKDLSMTRSNVNNPEGISLPSM